MLQLAGPPAATAFRLLKLRTELRGAVSPGDHRRRRFRFEHFVHSRSGRSNGGERRRAPRRCSTTAAARSISPARTPARDSACTWCRGSARARRGRARRRTSCTAGLAGASRRARPPVRSHEAARGAPAREASRRAPRQDDANVVDDVAARSSCCGARAEPKRGVDGCAAAIKRSTRERAARPRTPPDEIDYLAEKFTATTAIPGTPSS